MWFSPTQGPGHGQSLLRFRQHPPRREEGGEDCGQAWGGSEEAEAVLSWGLSSQETRAGPFLRAQRF